MDDSKFQSTVLGRPADVGDIEIEGGGDIKTIADWVRQRTGERTSSSREVNGHGGGGGGEVEGPSPSASSGLSSVGDRLNGEGLDDMDLA